MPLNGMENGITAPRQKKKRRNPSRGEHDRPKTVQRITTAVTLLRYGEDV